MTGVREAVKVHGLRTVRTGVREAVKVHGLRLGAVGIVCDGGDSGSVGGVEAVLSSSEDAIARQLVTD